MGFMRRLNRTGEDRHISRLSSHSDDSFLPDLLVMSPRQVQQQQQLSPAPPSWNVGTTADALRFTLSVKREFTAERYKYDEFVQIMREFSRGSIATEDVMSRVKVLFDGHHSLILAFNEFLPAGYKINIEGGEESA